MRMEKFFIKLTQIMSAMRNWMINPIKISYKILQKSLYLCGVILTVSIAMAASGDIIHTASLYNLWSIARLTPLLFFISLIIYELFGPWFITINNTRNMILIKNITGIVFCLMGGYWSFLDEGIFVAIIVSLFLFAIMSTGDILINMDEIFDTSKYASQMISLCILISGFISIYCGYRIFFTSSFIGVFHQKCFLLFLVVAPCLFLYVPFLPKNHNFSYRNNKISKDSRLSVDILKVITVSSGNFTRGSLFILFLIAFRTLFYDIMYVPSGSMTPTLRIGDLVLVKKYHYSLSNEMMWPIGRIIPWIPEFYRKDRHIARNDIVVWTQDNFGTFATLVKRVVAVGGDTFSVDDNHIVLNNQECDWIHVKTKTVHRDDQTPVVVGYKLEITPDGHTRTIQTDSVRYTYSDTDTYEVPADHFCVVGDNRTQNGSHDCRDQSVFPPIHKSRVIGYPKYVVLSSKFWLKWKKDSGWLEFVGLLPIRAISYFRHLHVSRCCRKVQPLNTENNADSNEKDFNHNYS